MHSLYIQFFISAIPIITPPPQDATVLLGGEVTFICRAIGIPVPNITWSSENNINISATSTVLENSRISTLSLTNLTSSYFNQSYTCTASNDHGINNSSVVLTEGSESSVLST